MSLKQSKFIEIRDYPYQIDIPHTSLFIIIFCAFGLPKICLNL